MSSSEFKDQGSEMINKSWRNHQARKKNQNTGSLNIAPTPPPPQSWQFQWLSAIFVKTKIVKRCQEPFNRLLQVLIVTLKHAKSLCDEDEGAYRLSPIWTQVIIISTPIQGGWGGGGGGASHCDFAHFKVAINT